MGQEREPWLSIPVPEAPGPPSAQTQSGQDPALLHLMNILDALGLTDELLGRVCLPA